MIKGMKYEWVEMLNLMGKGDIYQENYDGIVLLCIRCSRRSSRTKSGMRTLLTRNSNITSGGVTRAEVANLLEKFKTDILRTLNTQLDVLQAKQKKTKEEQTLAIFFHRCRRKHGPRDCPLDVVQVCAICTKDHDTEQFPSLPRLKDVFREAKEETKPLYLMA
jgi:protein-tyrosine-phosphatase